VEGLDEGEFAGVQGEDCSALVFEGVQAYL
jgi:hypothetical protein